MPKATIQVCVFSNRIAAKVSAIKKIFISTKELLLISQFDASGPLAERERLRLLGSLHQPECSLSARIFHLARDSAFDADSL